ncbi:MAG: hypothetical protein KY432_03455 [Acidobacteria bacterium]|nr:hypothetical protein [Acidobacteriota bacterium]
MNDFSQSGLIKRVDDLLRQELLNLGWDYEETIDRLEEAGRGDLVMIHFHGQFQAIEIPRPEEGIDDSTFSAQIRRRVKVALEGPPPFVEPIEDHE